MTNILAIGASNSSNSINKQLATWISQQIAKQLTKQGEVKTLDLNDFEMSIYSPDRETNSGIPGKAHAFLKQIKEADIIVLSLAEHNGSYSAAYKNIYDWASRIEQKVWNGKPVFLTSSSPGPRGGATVLAATANSLPYQGGQLYGNITLGSFYDNFNVEEGITNNELAKTFEEKIGELSSQFNDN